MKYLLLLGLLISCKFNFVQNKDLFVYDTLSHNKYLCLKTDFSLIDNIGFWNYRYDPKYRGFKNALVKPIGKIYFWRTDALDDGTGYGRDWKPEIDYEIYYLKDSSYCFQESLHTMLISSCLAPDAGGDILLIGNFIFFNHDVCVDCCRYSDKKDYCRPLINDLFKKIDLNKAKTLNKLIDQLNIKEGELKMK